MPNERFSRSRARHIRPANRARRAAFSLLEITAAFTFVVVVLIGLSTLFIASRRSTENAREEAIITHYLRYMSEKIRGTPFTDIATVYQGYTFPLPDLVGVEGLVEIFVDETDSSPAAQELGLPRDLDGDGVADRLDVSASYILLPIRITITKQSDVTFFRVHRFLVSQEE